MRPVNVERMRRYRYTERMRRRRAETRKRMEALRDLVNSLQEKRD